MSSSGLFDQAGARGVDRASQRLDVAARSDLAGLALTDEAGDAVRRLASPAGAWSAVSQAPRSTAIRSQLAVEELARVAGASASGRSASGPADSAAAPAVIRSAKRRGSVPHGRSGLDRGLDPRVLAEENTRAPDHPSRTARAPDIAEPSRPSARPAGGIDLSRGLREHRGAVDVDRARRGDRQRGAIASTTWPFGVRYDDPPASAPTNHAPESLPATRELGLAPGAPYRNGRPTRQRARSPRRRRSAGRTGPSRQHRGAHDNQAPPAGPPAVLLAQRGAGARARQRERLASRPERAHRATGSTVLLPTGRPCGLTCGWNAYSVVSDPAGDARHSGAVSPLPVRSPRRRAATIGH